MIRGWESGVCMPLRSSDGVGWVDRFLKLPGKSDWKTRTDDILLSLPVIF